jgi:hypothetical protein
MLNKYLKKILLTTVAIFWASCDDSTSAKNETNAPTNGDINDMSIVESSSDGAAPLSSSEAPASSNAAESSSSNAAESSSDVVASSSDAASSSTNFDPNGMPSDTLYGVSVTEKTCVPGDSIVSYYPPAYSADILKMNAKQQAEMDMVDVIDSIVDPRPRAERIEAPLDSINWSNFPQCLKRMRESLERFVALYGAPENFPMEWVCSDGTTRPTEEYQKYQKMMEEWEANKPALDEEINKIIEDRFKELEEQLNKCLNNSNGETNT